MGEKRQALTSLVSFPPGSCLGRTKQKRNLLTGGMNIHDASRMLRDTEGRKVGQMSRLPKLLFIQLARKSFSAERELCRGGITSLLLDFFLKFLIFHFLLCAAARIKKKKKKN